METLKEILGCQSNTQQQQINFLLENRTSILGVSYIATEYDYEIFVDCMTIYLTTGKNYFERYKRLYFSIQNHQLEKGIKGFYKSQKSFHTSEWNIMAAFEEAIASRIADMHFFEIETINGCRPQDYEAFLDKAHLELNAILEASVEERDEEKARIEKYFNFTDFDQNQLEYYYKDCIQTLESRSYQVQDLAHLEKSNYLIVQYSRGIAIKIGITHQPLQWAHKLEEAPEASTYGIYQVPEDYCKELKVKVCLHYPTIEGYSSMVQMTNKMYANFKQARNVYHYLNGLNLAHLKRIIEINEIKQHFIGGATIIEKAVLDKAVKKFLSIENKA